MILAVGAIDGPTLETSGNNFVLCFVFCFCRAARDGAHAFQRDAKSAHGAHANVHCMQRPLHETEPHESYHPPPRHALALASDSAPVARDPTCAGTDSTVRVTAAAAMAGMSLGTCRLLTHT